MYERKNCSRWSDRRYSTLRPSIIIEKKAEYEDKPYTHRRNQFISAEGFYHSRKAITNVHYEDLREMNKVHPGRIISVPNNTTTLQKSIRVYFQATQIMGKSSDTSEVDEHRVVQGHSAEIFGAPEPGHECFS